MTNVRGATPAPAWPEKIDRLARALPHLAPALAALRAAPGTPAEASRAAGGQPPPDPERAAVAGPTPPDPDDPHAIRTVGVIGGGTAGYLTALALRAKRPWLDVTLVESSRIPVIGVGEATTPPLTAFLHRYLDIDPHDFFAAVRPTWKLGIRFDWGPYQDGFMAPFDWGHNSVGVLGSLAARNDPNAFTLQSLFMLADRVPVFRLPGGEPLSLMDDLPFAYHLENRGFVRYLTEHAAKRGVRHLDAEIAHVELGGDESVRALHTKDGRHLQFDLYIDCTGFRSLLLGQALRTPYISYEDSLFTDCALTGYTGQSAAIAPYTRATTMDAGWCWSIPVPGEDHVGYVHSTRFQSPEGAADELLRLHPGVADLKTVRFRVGRHERMWRGNVIAMGNSYGFVEPLESSALLMLIFSIMSMMPLLPVSWKEPAANRVLNDLTARRWDGLRWFLAMHYRYNNRRDTPFWQEARTATDVSGVRQLLDVYAAGAPLHHRDALTRRFVRSVAPTFFELDGVDCVLLGQDYPARLLTTTEPPADWQRRKAAADALVAHSLTQREALREYATEPALVDQLVYGPGSWVSRYGAEGWLRASQA